MHLHFSIGGYPGPFFEVVLKGEELVFTESSLNESGPLRLESVCVLNNEVWRSLVNFLMEVNWKKVYTNNEVVDGTHWELTFTNDDKKMHASGSNAYPRNFKKFLFYLKSLFKDKSVTIY